MTVLRPNLFPIPVPPPARLSTMPRPRGGDWLDDEMQVLRGAGVDVLVSLLTVVEQDELGLSAEADAAVRAGLDFYAFPIVDFGIPDRAVVRRHPADVVASVKSRHLPDLCCQVYRTRPVLTAPDSDLSERLISRPTCTYPSRAGC